MTGKIMYPDIGAVLLCSGIINGVRLMFVINLPGFYCPKLLPVNIHVYVQLDVECFIILRWKI